MDVSFSEVIVWLIIGALAGSLAARVMHPFRWRTGYGIVGNTILGLIGALVGGLVVKALDIGPFFPEITVSLHDIIVAFIGAVLFLLLLGFLRRF